MNKYFNRVTSEFEQILTQLNYDTSYCEAVNKANEYVSEFAFKKHLNASEKSEILEILMDLVQDWFPAQIVYMEF